MMKDAEKFELPEDQSCTSGAECRENRSPVILSDIEGHWASAMIRELVNRGVIHGYPDGTFRPNRSLTRAEFVVLLVQILGLKVEHGVIFTDTQEHWAKEAISTAQHQGLIQGYSRAVFAPNDPITREQMAVILTKAIDLRANASDKASAASADSTLYDDADEVSVWARDAVQSVTELRMMIGTPGNSFKPQASTTRAEAAVVLLKLTKQFE